jgi:FkbM family methyltransferase
LSLVSFMRRPDVRQRPILSTFRRLGMSLDRAVSPSRLHRELITRFDGGVLAEVRLDNDIERALYVYGWYEYVSSIVWTSLLRPGGTAGDVGANIGAFTLMAAARVGDRGTVHSFEPHPVNAARLQRNVELNGFGHVVIHRVAVSDRGGEAVLHVPAGELAWGSLSRHEAGGDALAVQLCPLDSVFAEAGVRVDALKVDVEGHELEAFRGAARTIEEQAPVVMFEVNAEEHEGAAAASSSAYLRDAGYRLFGMSCRRPGSWSLQEVMAGDDPMRFREDWVALNLLACRPGSPLWDTVAARVETV